MSQATGTTPAELCGVSEMYGPYLAYCFDQSVVTFGRSLEAELDGIEGKNRKEIERKRGRVLSRWLDIPQKYRDPAGSRG